MPKQAETSVEQKLDIIIGLLKHLVVLELARSGVKQAEIAKHVRFATAKVSTLLKGVKVRQP
jgi:hypothetical protein